MAETIKIGGELESTATGNVVAAASAIKDKVKNKYQGEINAETDASLADRYTKAETYNKTELNNLITTPNQQYVSVTATAQTTSATDVLPATGEANTIYRVGNWDGSQFDATVYSEYAWNGSSYVHLNKKTQIGEVFDISVYHATGGTLATYADLSAALDSNNGGGVPQSLQKGGMSIKFVQSSDNKYIQYFLTKDEWSTSVDDWQKMNLEEEVNQLGQEILMPNVKNLKDYIINGNINDSTGAIQPGIPTRLTTSIYFKKVIGDYLIIDQTNSVTKFSFSGYKHTQIGTTPEWISYKTTNIVKIYLEDGYFYSLLIANGSNNISPSELANVKFSYGFYDDVKSSLTYLTDYTVNKECVKSNKNSISEGIRVGDKGKISFSVILDSFSNSGKCFVKNTPNNNIQLYIDLSFNKILFRISDSGDITINNNVLHLYSPNTIEFEWDGVTNPNSKTYSLKINGETASSGNYTGTIDGTIKIQGDGSWKCVDAIWLYCKINNEHIAYNDTFEIVDDPVYDELGKFTFAFEYEFLGDALPNIVSNESETYMDLGPDPGIMVNGQVYWFSYWYPDNSDAYRKINLKQYTQGESILRVIVADLVEHTISNVPYHFITQNRGQYKNCVILFSFCIATPLPKNVQGINYAINGGEDINNTGILTLNPDIKSKVANSARAFHYDSTIGTSPLNLIYFSDIHGDTERTRRLFELKGDITSYIDEVLFTGDSDNYPNDTTWWNDYAKQMLIALGNHEYMIEKVEGVWQHATPQQVYDKFIAPYKSYWTGVVFPDNSETGKSYYYKDYAAKKVRLIALDYMEINLNTNSTQIAWLTSTLNDVLTNHSDYHVVIAVHQCAFKAEQNFKNPFDSIDFNSADSGVLPVGIPQAVDAFINNGGHFVCYFTGHDHVDHFGLGENYPNQLNVSICCASMYANANTMDVQRVADTKSQDLFNIVSIDTYSSLIKMIRVGCDYDRQLRKKDTICFYYGNDVFDSQKTYQIGQIVLYQSKIYQFLRNYNGGGWNPAIVCEIDRLIYVNN